MKRILAAIIFATIHAIGTASFVGAIDENIWKADQDFSIERSPYMDNRVEQGICQQYKITVLSGQDQEALVQPSCIVDGANVSFARYVDATRPWPYPAVERLAIKKSDDLLYHVLNGVAPTAIQFQPLQSGYVLVHNLNHSSNDDYADYEVIKNINETFVFDVGGQYNYVPDRNIQLFKYSPTTERDSWQSLITGIAVSKNGRYVAGYGNYKFIVVADLQTGSERVIGREAGTNYGGYSNPYIAAISNDGNYAFVGNSDKMYFLNNDCGEPLTANLHSRDYHLDAPCQSTSLAVLIREKIPYSYMGVLFEFNDESTSLSYITYYLLSEPSLRENIIIKTQTYGSVNRLKYLALGDSYSSGEGDVEESGTSYYTSETDYSGGCHISTRSYPYIVASLISISTSSSRSIACSGAQTSPDLISKDTSYVGQNRQLVNLSDVDKNNARQAALKNFIPGVVPQIEFVKKYQPKIITVTAGGNDVGFGSIILECAGLYVDEYIIGYLTNNATCKHALPYSKSRTALIKTIEEQYQYINMFVRQVQEVSPETEVYLIGYPSFIAEHFPTCKLDAGLLNNIEISSINKFVTLMNNQIMRVAADRNVHYVDITNALYGGRLCEGGEYITGMNDLPGHVYGYSEADRQQAFHPNAAAHAKIAKIIYEKMLAR